MRYLIWIVLVLAFVTSAMSQHTLYVMGGTIHNERIADVQSGSGTFSLDHTYSFNDKWGSDVTFTYSADRERGTQKGNSWSVLGLVEYFPNPKVFVGTGVQVTRFSNSAGSLININPTVEAGLYLPYKKLAVEPYIQAGLPDLVQRSRGRNIGGGANVYYNTTKHTGLRFSGYVFENYWNGGKGASTGVLAGFYYKF